VVSEGAVSNGGCFNLGLREPPSKGRDDSEESDCTKIVHAASKTGGGKPIAFKCSALAREERNRTSSNQVESAGMTRSELE